MLPMLLMLLDSAGAAGAADAATAAEAAILVPGHFLVAKSPIFTIFYFV